MKIVNASKLDPYERKGLLRRTPLCDSETIQLCESIFARIRSGGDSALRRFSRQFDGVDLRCCRVARREFDVAAQQVSKEARRAIQHAARNITRFHEAQKFPQDPVEVQQGVRCWRELRPIDSVGLYVPAGTAPLASTLLMLAIPARLAGCSEISVCVPPRADGTADPHVLSAAETLGVDTVYKMGGAQAIAAMVFGTETVPAVSKIVGPGCRVVQSAKALAVQYGVAIDLLAGPSEILVISDGSGSPDWIAADLISQAEHGADSRAVLVTTDRRQARQVASRLREQVARLPRGQVALEALQQSFILVVRCLQEAVEFANDYAPEHLVLQMEEPTQWQQRVRSAGSVFLGPYSPVAAGDYASGTNHTLPTSGTAAAYSGVSVHTFLRHISFQQLTRQGLESLAPTLKTLAQSEGLEGHVRAVECRLDSSSTTAEPLQSGAEEKWNPVGAELASMTAYQPARLFASGGTLLDANESPFDEELGGVLLNRYPDPHQQELRQELAQYVQCPPEMILAGSGSDEVLDWLIRAFCRGEADAIAVAQPTYSMYEVLAASYGIDVLHFPLGSDFDFSAEDFLQTVRPGIKILFLCSPNNPTGNCLSRGEVETVCCSWRGLVVMDEAYVEFSSSPSLADRVAELRNLVIVRTLSKAWGRASLRVGYLVAVPEIIQALEKIKFPYNLGGLTMALAMECLRKVQTVEQRVGQIQGERRRLQAALADMPGIHQIFPSEANFVLFRCHGARDVCSRLKDRKIVVRDRSGLPRLENTLRVSVGTPEQNSQFLSTLKEVLNDQSCHAQAG